MKVVFKASEAVTFECEVADALEGFTAVSGLEELFGDHECGLCKSAHIRHDVREFSGNLFYKLVCSGCGAQLDFGQYKDKARGLFAKRSEHPETRGWYKYEGGPRNSAPTVPLDVTRQQVAGQLVRAGLSWDQAWGLLNKRHSKNWSTWEEVPSGIRAGFYSWLRGQPTKAPAPSAMDQEYAYQEGQGASDEIPF